MLCRCEDETGGDAGDYVVKLRGSMDHGDSGSLCELVGSLLATEFGLLVPEPALVIIDEPFAAQVSAIELARSRDITRSVGLNFGCNLMKGVTAWPVDKSIPDAMLQAAVNVFAFDALIQNPDRRYSNQNLFTRGDDIFVYDHELAFSFLVGILTDPEPWKVERDGYLADHVFYRQLRSRPVDLDKFLECLSALPGRLSSITTMVPQEWNNGKLARIDQHLRLMAAQSQRFGEELRRALA